MTISQIGLILDVIGVIMVGMEANYKTKGINPSFITLKIPSDDQDETVMSQFKEWLWKKCMQIGYILILIGFALQYLGTLKT